jgi:chaperonin GroES
MSTPLKPLGDRLIAVVEEAENKTASGLYLPDNAKEKPKVAKVVAVGPGKVGDDNERIPVSVKVGDRIVYKEYSTTEIKVNGAEYIVVSEDDVLATLA